MREDVVRLSVPAKAEYLVAARLVAGAIFGQAGFDMDDIADAKTALSEACLLLMPDEKEKADLHIEMRVNDGVHTVVSTEGSPAQNTGAPGHEFSLFMLEALIDSVKFEQEGGRSSYRLFKALPV
ncbi:MAG: hypothetical protein LBS18_08625 [Clostridiales bacterium]|jgi:serine/threonine-protein kinase RsbW|nr:hypothetical protein [Clostridiales bacterium]